MNWYKLTQINNIPNALYHATFQHNLSFIKKNGLLPNPPVKYWEDSLPGVYLHENPDIAYNYCETAEPLITNIPDSWRKKIIVFEINTFLLDKNLLEYDPNVWKDDQSYVYNGVISFSMMRII